MSTYFTLSLLGLPIIVLGDILWFTLIATDFYKARIGHLLGDLVWQPAVLFYVLYAFGITYFVTYHNLDASLTKVALNGAFFGFIAYATFDLTSQALIKGWSWQVTVVDMLWGTILAAFATTSALVLYRTFFA